MFDESAIRNVIEQSRKAQSNFKDELTKMAICGSSGGDSVQVVIDGHKEVTKIEISEIATRNPTLLPDLVMAALNVAYEKVDKELANRTPPSMQSFLKELDFSSIMDMFKK